MSKYIDADELYVDWYDSFVADDGTEYDNVPLITKGQIDDAPSIDIVFCKECVFREEDAEAEMYRCLLISFPHWNRGEHFCADGEREGE